MLRSLAVAALLACPALWVMSGAAVCWGEDWRQWRGPAGDGVSGERGLPQRWTREQIAVNSLGESSNSSAAISNGRLFLRTHKSLWCPGNKE
ncbi:hypothetical protein LBMAG46_33550 [Planctomycetia bacterium]|nr:hypothetical protein LBMAG46_33550 [Planctomycetia bacterium]